MNKTDFLVNYDVQKEQAALIPLARSLEVLAKDLGKLLPGFLTHLKQQKELTEPFLIAYVKPAQCREELQEVLTTLNAMTKESKKALLEVIAKSDNDPRWFLPLKCVFNKNGISIPLTAIEVYCHNARKITVDHFELDPDHKMDQTQQEYPQIVDLIHNRVHQMSFGRVINQRSVPLRALGNEHYPSRILFGKNPLHIREVRFLMFHNGGPCLSRASGPAKITYRPQANTDDSKLSVTSTIWCFQGSDREGLALEQERLQAWHDRLKLKKSDEGQRG